jgi:cytoplasmic iron level regulating protein YaaA (DUF328/UPF0246 family)
MLITLSPAKTLDFGAQKKTTRYTTPDLLAESRKLVKQVRKLSAGELGALMKISDKLAAENHQRYRTWKTPFTPDNAKQAILAFRGEVYVGLAADEFDAAGFRYAQKSLRILSGLYGVLRPLDLIQPYRLEMGTRLETDRGADLYEFWGDRIAKCLNQALSEDKSKELVNLASNEYFKSVRSQELQARVITPSFKEERDGKFKMISFFAKTARGRMASFAVRNRIERAEDLKSFDLDGYRYNAELSGGDEWVFTRRETK